MPKLDLNVRNNNQRYRKSFFSTDGSHFFFCYTNDANQNKFPIGGNLRIEVYQTSDFTKVDQISRNFDDMKEVRKIDALKIGGVNYYYIQEGSKIFLYNNGLKFQFKDYFKSSAAIYDLGIEHGNPFLGNQKGSMCFYWW